MSTTRIRVSVTVAFVLVLLALGWFLGISPQLTQAAAADQQRVAVEGQNAAHEAQLTRLAMQFADLPGLTAQLTALQGEINPVNDLAAVADSVGDLVEAAGATLSLYTADAPVSAVAVTPDPVVGGEGLYAVPVTATISGTDAQVLEIVRSLQSQQQLFLVTGLTLGEAESKVVSGFVFITAEVPDAPAAAPAAPAPDLATSASP